MNSNVKSYRVSSVDKQESDSIDTSIFAARSSKEYYSKHNDDDEYDDVDDVDDVDDKETSYFEASARRRGNSEKFIPAKVLRERKYKNNLGDLFS